jgi:serine/threonine-protein kinase
LFLTYAGEVKIVDFGIAKALLNSEKTETGTLKGKVSYMAPEQVRGTVDRRADLFAMGVVLWGFFTGKKLFEGERGSVLYRLMTDPIPGLASEMPDVDPRLASIVDRALQKDPDHRFQTAEEMREVLEEYIRASGELVPDVKLGKIVREAFAETRQRVQRQIQAAISRAAPAGPGDEILVESMLLRAPLPEIGSVTPSQEMFAPWESSRPTGSLSVPSLRMGTLPPVDPVSASVLTKPRRLLFFGALGAAIVVIAIVLFIALGTKNSSVASAPPPAPLGPVEITSNPPGARVELNGNVLGRTPGRFDLPPGPHTLIVSMDAYKSEVVVVQATTSPTSRAVELKPNAEPAAQPAITAKANEAANTNGAAAGEESPKANDVVPEPAGSPHPTAPRATPPHPAPPRQPPVRVRTPATNPKGKETAAPNPAVTSPRVKVIEEDPKRKIDIIND